MPAPWAPPFWRREDKKKDLLWQVLLFSMDHSISKNAAMRVLSWPTSIWE